MRPGRSHEYFKCAVEQHAFGGGAVPVIVPCWEGGKTREGNENEFAERDSEMCHIYRQRKVYISTV